MNLSKTTVSDIIKRYIRRKTMDVKNLTPTIKHGGGHVMVGAAWLLLEQEILCSLILQ